MKRFRQLPGYAAFALLGGLLCASPAGAASSRGYETPIDPRDLANPNDYANRANARPSAQPPDNYPVQQGFGAGEAGHYLNPATGALIDDPAYVAATPPRENIRPTEDEINRYIGTAYQPSGGVSAPAPGDASGNKKGVWYKPWSYRSGDSKKSSGYEQPAGEYRVAPAPVPAPAPTYAPPPAPVYAPPAATPAYSGEPYYAPSPYANTAPPSAAALTATGLDGVPSGIGIQLPSGSAARVASRDAPYSPTYLNNSGLAAGGYVGGGPASPTGYDVAPTSANTGIAYTSPSPAGAAPPLGLPPPGVGSDLALAGTWGGPTPGQAVPPPTGDSPTGQAAFERAKSLMRPPRERYADALVEIESAIQNGYATAEVYRWRGDGQYNLLRLREAIESYRLALALAPDNYFARRGQGLAHLHLGHQIHTYQLDAQARKDDEAAKQYFREAHDCYKTALQAMRGCVAERPNDLDAVYGLAMAAEGTSRALYSLAISNLRKQNRFAADGAATECLNLINEGLQYALIRYDKVGKAEKEAGALTIAGGLFLRQAKLQHAFDNTSEAIENVKRAINIQRMILSDIDGNNQSARDNLAECETELATMSGMAV